MASTFFAESSRSIRRKIICTEDHKGHKTEGTKDSGIVISGGNFADWPLILTPLTSRHSRLAPIMAVTQAVTPTIADANNRFRTGRAIPNVPA
jgi:hypothetical protein